MIGLSIILGMFSNNVNAEIHEVNKDAFQHAIRITKNNNYIYSYDGPCKKEKATDNNMHFLVYGNDESDYYRGNKDKYYVDFYTEHSIRAGCNQSNCEICSEYNTLDDDVKNKFDELVQLRKEQKLDDDLMTYLTKIVKKVFGNNFNVIYDYNYGLMALDEKNIVEIDNKKYIKRFTGTIEEFLNDKKSNGYELCSKIEDYQWKRTYVWDCSNLPICLHNKYHRDLIITDGNILYYYNSTEHYIKTYKKIGSNPEFTSTKQLIANFDKIGQNFYERYNKELQIIKQVFGYDCRIHYNMIDKITIFS